MHKVIACLLTSFALLGCDSRPDLPGAGISGIGYVGVTVADLERSTEFYRAGADMQVVDGSSSTALAPITTLADSDLQETQLLESANAQLRFMQFESVSTESAVPVHGPGIAHVCYQVNKLTGAYGHFLDAGAEHIGAREMVSLTSNPVEYAYARDLDGIMFEVEHVDVAALDLETPPANDYRIRHVSLATPDIDTAVAFYSTLLDGQEARRSSRFFSISGDKVDQVSGLVDSKLKMAWLQTRNLELEFVQYVSHPTERPATPRPLSAPGYNMIVFDVDNLEAAQASLLAAGGALVAEVQPMDGGEILFGRDLDGNLLGFQKVAADSPVSSMKYENNGT